MARGDKLQKYFNKEECRRILNDYSKLCTSHFKNLAIDKKIARGISNLAKKGVQLYILSGGNAVEIRSCLKNNEIENYFYDILAEEQTKMNHLQMAKTTEKDLLIGDSTYDYYCAKKFKINFMRLVPSESPDMTDNIEIPEPHSVLFPGQFLDFSIK